MSEHKTKFKAGDVITWTSGAAGIAKTKTGEVTGVLADNEYPWKAYERLRPGDKVPPRTAFKSGFGWGPHYLVRVHRPVAPKHKSSTPIFYCPRVLVIDGASASAGKLVSP